MENSESKFLIKNPVEFTKKGNIRHIIRAKVNFKIKQFK